MDELIQQAAAQLGYPAEMIERSARARAAADGSSVEAVLAAWVGGEAPPAAAATAPAAAAEPAAAPAAPAPPAAASGPAVEELPPATEAATEESPAEADDAVDEEREPAAAGGVPRWLAAAFVLVPLVALLYALWVPNGPACGDGGVLAVDPVTGEAVNCDGSAYGSTEVNFFSLGQATFAQCAACHGADGAGSGQFPALAGGAVVETFPDGQCNDQVEWVRLGTLGWPDATYGATNKPVGGSGAQMPAFGSALSEDELRAVVLYERVAFGGAPLDAALTECGLDEAGGAEMVAAG